MTQRLVHVGFDHLLDLVIGTHGEGIPWHTRSDPKNIMQRDNHEISSDRIRFSKECENTVLDQIYLSIGVETMRGMTRLWIDNLDAILVDTTSTKAVTARRNRAHHLYYEQWQTYNCISLGNTIMIYIIYIGVQIGADYRLVPSKTRLRTFLAHIIP